MNKEFDEESALLGSNNETVESSSRSNSGLKISLAAVTSCLLLGIGAYFSGIVTPFKGITNAQFNVITNFNNGVLCQGSEITKGTTIYSASGDYKVTFQVDGSLNIKKKTGRTLKNLGRGDRWAFQDDGNLVLYSGLSAQKATMTHGKNELLVIQNDGDLVVYDENQDAIWRSDTKELIHEPNVPLPEIFDSCRTAIPTLSPSLQPLANPTHNPSMEPTNQPVADPTFAPTLAPSKLPTLEPTFHPTLDPTIKPSNEPVANPTHEPTKEPTLAPTHKPSQEPTKEPTFVPTLKPSFAPSDEPTQMPIAQTQKPTFEPSQQPTLKPTVLPTSSPVPGLIPLEPTDPNDLTSVKVAPPDAVIPPFEDSIPLADLPPPAPVAPVAPVTKPASTPVTEPEVPVEKPVVKPATTTTTTTPATKPVVKKAPVPITTISPPNYCSFTFVKGKSYFGAPKGCSLFAEDDLSYLKPGEKTAAFYACADDKATLNVSQSKLVKAGLLKDGKSLVTAIFPGPSVYVTFFTNPDFTGYDYTFNSNYHHELTQFHFEGTTLGNDQVKSIRLKSLTSSFTLPENCVKSFRLD